ncbi:hypothetical protein PtB15_15B379 [Puccinia triticina]|nr:hypothetical protein PtB15_15B379 [Puccinia triticina]
MQIKIYHSGVLLLLTIKCNGMEDLPHDYQSFFGLEVPPPDYMDHFMSSLSSESGHAYPNPTSPTRRAFENQFSPEDLAELPYLHSDFPVVSQGQRTAGLAPSIQHGENQLSSYLANESQFVPCGQFNSLARASTSPPETINTQIPSESGISKNGPDFCGDGQRKSPTLAARCKSFKKTASPRPMTAYSELQDRFRHPAETPSGELMLTARPSNLSPSASVYPKHEKTIWLGEIRDAPVNTDNCLVGEWPIEKNWKWERLCFDSTAFTNHRSADPGLYPKILKLIGKLSKQGPACDELVMTKYQFIQYHTDLNFLALRESRRRHDRDDRIKEDGSKQLVDNPRSPAMNKAWQRVTLAQNFLMLESQRWISHWSRRLHWNGEDLIEKFELVKPHKLKKAVSTFLFYVEMVETILPRPATERRQSKARNELAEAVAVLEALFNPCKAHENLEKRGYICDKIALKQSSNDAVSVMWAMIHVWVCMFRTDLVDVLFNERQEISHSAKSFFNTLFFCSIKVLSSRLKRDQS